MVIWGYQGILYGHFLELFWIILDNTGINGDIISISGVVALLKEFGETL